MKDLFKKYLDNSADCDTIKIELIGCDDFEKTFEGARLADCYWQKPREGYKYKQALFNLIRIVWDKAYSHGYHDAQAECGLTLAEIEE